MKSWQQAMFQDEADLFIRLLDNKPLPASLPAVLADIAGVANFSGKVLDLCCGPGRLTPLLAAKAASVVGIDSSSRLLEVARDRFSCLGNTAFVLGDMRRLPENLDGPFSLILRMYTSMGYFTQDEELEILRRCLALAAPGAALVVDTFNGDWFAANPTFSRTGQFGDLILTESYRCDDAHREVQCTWSYSVSSGQRPREFSIEFSLELYDRTRLGALLTAAGWSQPVAYADYSTQRLTQTSVPPERLVMVGFRP